MTQQLSIDRRGGPRKKNPPDNGTGGKTPMDVTIAPTVIHRPIASHRLDNDAVKVVQRLTRHGFEAYFVGGCIRDLLMDRQPKDFDVATSARPSQIKRLFRNCRLIGRRFRLAHILFRNDKVIEVATFRRTATDGDDVSKRHAAENLFGDPADDAVRRDFTINALFYDLNRQEVHDYVGGLRDIEQYNLRTIGDPHRRLPEDPVRIIRAVKFSSLLDLTIDPLLAETMRQYAPLITSCAPARLVEELLKLLRSGAATECLEQLFEVNVLVELMPNIVKQINRTGGPAKDWPVLRRSDSAIQQGQGFSDAVLVAAMLYPFCRSVLEGPGDVSSKLEETLVPLVEPLRFTKRLLARVRQVFMAQRRLAGGKETARIRRILKRDYAADAIDLMELAATNKELAERAANWRTAYLRVAVEKKSHPLKRKTKKRTASRQQPDRDKPRRKRKRSSAQ